MKSSHFIQRVKNAAHGIYSVCGMMRFGVLGKKMFVIGITGTDGKSSSVILTAAMLRRAGHMVAHFSSISYHDGLTEQVNEHKMTMLGRMGLHEFLSRAHKNGCTYAVVEVTSQGIIQHRHRGIAFSLVGITNITPEHIEAHRGFERYQAAKVSLVRELKGLDVRGLVIDHETYGRVKALVPPGIAIHEVDASTVVEESLSGVAIELQHGTERVVVRAQFGGPFAASTILFSATIASVCGVSLHIIRDAVESFGHIPGRFEIFSNQPLVIVDYAHTIHALTVLLPYVRAHTSGKLVHVFGAAGGGRDRYKRPLIAELSARSADTSILTEENSFDEPVTDIVSDIAKGFPAGHSFEIIPTREDAVAHALALATSPNDTVLLTAKGSEHVIVGPRGSKRPYDERAYITWLLKTASSH